MHLADTFSLITGLLSLAAVVKASPVPGIEGRINSARADTACSRRDVQLVSKLVKLSSKPQDLCANFLPQQTKPTRPPIQKASTKSARDLEHLEHRAFKLPTALKNYGTALITQSCKCLYPSREDTPTPVVITVMETVSGFPSDFPCIYSLGYTSLLLTNQASTDNYRDAGLECQENCRLDSQCKFAWLGRLIENNIHYMRCYKDSAAYSSSLEQCTDSGAFSAIAGYNKVERTT